jgi:hypothetical protein
VNGFEKWGIDFLSPSALGKWRDTPWIWVAERLGRVKDREGAPNLWRGRSVESGLRLMLAGADPAVSSLQALAEYDDLFAAAAEVPDGVQVERDRVSAMIGQLGMAVADPSVRPPDEWIPDTPPGRVEAFLPGVPVPLVGYIDFRFTKGTDVELKTGKQCPSSPREDNVRQTAFYRKATGRKCSLLYVTDKKYKYFTPTDAELDDALYQLGDDARSLEAFLRHVDDPEIAMRILPVPSGHWKFGKVHAGLVTQLAEAF